MKKSEEARWRRLQITKSSLFGFNPEEPLRALIITPEDIHKSIEKKVLPEEVEEKNPLSPTNFEEYIGQAEAKEIARIIVDSAIIRKGSLPNIMLFGPYGLGKTTLAKLIMDRFGQQYKFTDGTSVNRTYQIKGYYIIDEIHNLTSATADYLNTLLDRNETHIIGCTTNPGTLPAPFRSRFRTLHLQPYSETDIFHILEGAANRSNIEYTKVTLRTLSKRSKCNPRIALNTLQFATEIMLVQDEPILNSRVLSSTLNKLGIDEEGLTKVDKQYLSLLSGRPIGLQSICAYLGLSAETVENEIEPYLLQNGKILKSAKGRILFASQEESLEQQLINSLEQVRVRVNR